MGYPETLEVLARLHVDARFRQAWLQDAQAAMAPYALTPREREGLAGADALVVERAGRMLDGHRLSRVHEHLPWADPTLRPGLLPVLKDFLQDALPELLNREEAIAFCRYLEAASRGTLPAYMADLARCERLRISLAWGLEPMSGPSHFESFQYPVTELLAALAQPGWPEVPVRPTRVEYLKVPGLPAVLVRA
ncbi:MAG TPA: hypothetical protein VE153_32665 [Myxococcus sp.]|nr:hypothetical protein [Myxococcus sp.]